MIRLFDSRWGYGWESNVRLIPIFANSTQCYQASTIHWKIEHVWILVRGVEASGSGTLRIHKPKSKRAQSSNGLSKPGNIEWNSQKWESNGRSIPIHSPNGNRTA